MINIDMDGVLADLYNFIGQRIYGKQYKDVTKEEKIEARSIWKDKEAFYKHLGGTEEVFTNLPAFETNHELLEFVVMNFGNFQICSHPSPIHTDECIAGKKKWIGEHIIDSYHGDNYIGAIFPVRKADHAIDQYGRPNILIDDWQPYVDDWIQAGGIAISLKSTNFEPHSGELTEYLIEEFAKWGIKTNPPLI
jgi:5'(3')-deoxyribonucleotidase